MLIVLADARFDPAQADDVAAIARPMIEASRAEAGCAGYDYAFDMLEPGRANLDPVGAVITVESGIIIGKRNARVAKAVADACNGIVWVDDAQVVEVVARKGYAVPGREGASITVEAL